MVMDASFTVSAKASNSVKVSRVIFSYPTREKRTDGFAYSSRSGWPKLRRRCLFYWLIIWMSVGFKQIVPIVPRLRVLKLRFLLAKVGLSLQMVDQNKFTLLGESRE